MAYLFNALISVIAILLTIAFLVWRANPSRTSNQQFVWLTMMMMGFWVSSLFIGFDYSHSGDWAGVELYVLVCVRPCRG